MRSGLDFSGQINAVETEDVDGDSSEKILGQKQKQIPTVVILPQPRTGTEV